MAVTVLEGLDGIRAAAGSQLGHSDWWQIDEEQVRRFAAATGAPEAVDDVVPPLLLLALTNRFLPEIVEVRGVALGVNYGTGAVRFPAPLPVGARVRGVAELTEVADIDGGVQTTMRITVEVEGGDEPAAVVDALSRWLR